ncbi:MAG: ATP-binding protein, partial [Methylophilaceae bacterium]
AQATRVTITVEKQTDQNSSFIYIRIDDNGIGLDQSQKFGLGLPGMKERIVGIDGKINFTSQDGTTIEAWIPIK